MCDDQETKCIIAAILALRNQKHGNYVHGSENNEKEETDTTTSVLLPDAVIRDKILSYRPFRSFRVVLIRGENTGYNNINNNHYHYDNTTCCRREYSLTFGTNRGPLRFRVVEHPYLPPHSTNGSAVDAETYRGADGVVISCYMARFFEFCDRYGYDYASSSILEDIHRRRHTNPQQSNSNDQEPAQGQTDAAPNSRTSKNSKDESNFPKSIVLCGNNVDITHVDARLSSIVFWQDSAQDESHENEWETKRKPPRSHIEKPRHPFSSLARSITNDDGLEFHHTDAYSNSCDEVLGPACKSLEWNHDDDLCNWNWLRAHVSL